MPDPLADLVADDDHELRPGALIDERYLVQRKLGGGAMGDVYRAEHTRVGRSVALKVLAHELAHDSDFRRRFEAEARAASAAGHPGIVQVLDAGVLDDGRPFLVMEELRGRELLEELTASGPMSEQRAGRLVRDLARAVHAAHEVGVIHRDLKPENVYVVDGPHGETVKVIDFGIAYAPDFHASRLTRPGVAVGTPEYMSPEQIAGGEPTRASDVYAMGAILYELLVGTPPFCGDSILAIINAKAKEAAPDLLHTRPGTDPALARLVGACLAFEPSGRPATAADLADRLDAVLRGSATAILAPPRPPPGRSPLWIVAGSVALVAVVIGGWVLAQGNEPPRSFATGLSEAGGDIDVDMGRPKVPVWARLSPPSAPPVVPDPQAPPIDAPPPQAREAQAAPRAVAPRRPEPSKSVPAPACGRTVEEARDARGAHDWRGVLRHTQDAACWPSKTERRQLRVKAYAELGRFDRCIATGKGSTDPETARTVDLCRRKRGAP